MLFPVTKPPARRNWYKRIIRTTVIGDSLLAARHICVIYNSLRHEIVITTYLNRQWAKYFGLHITSGQLNQFHANPFLLTKQKEQRLFINNSLKQFYTYSGSKHLPFHSEYIAYSNTQQASLVTGHISNINANNKIEIMLHYCISLYLLNILYRC